MIMRQIQEQIALKYNHRFQNHFKDSVNQDKNRIKRSMR